MEAVAGSMHSLDKGNLEHLCHEHLSHSGCRSLRNYSADLIFPFRMIWKIKTIEDLDLFNCALDTAARDVHGKAFMRHHRAIYVAFTEEHVEFLRCKGILDL